MSTLSKLLLLACVAALSFARFQLEQAWIFWTLLGLLFPLTALLYVTTFHISRKAAMKSMREAGRTSQNLAGIQVLPLATYIPLGSPGDGSKSESSFGRIAVGEGLVLFYVRRKGIMTELLSFPVAAVTGFNVGNVYGNRSGVQFHLKDNTSRTFTIFRAKELRKQVEKALGWKHQE